MSTIQYLGDNIYTFPPNIKRMFFDSKQGHMTRKLKAHADEVCRNEMPQAYINKAFNKYRYGYVYTKGDEIIGFIIWQVMTRDAINTMNSEMYPSKYVFIHLLCAKKTGTDFGFRMLSDVESYCVKNGIACMNLHAANIKLETYYKQFGFFTTQKYPEILMWKPIVTLLREENTNYKKTRKRRNARISEHDKKIIMYLNKEGASLEEGLNYSPFFQNTK
jgi:hypothetical protein